MNLQKKKKKPKVRDFLNTLNIQDAINLRDCYFGGRTNALVLHKKFADGEKGMYVDFTSLYPDILKYRRFPVGHPERIIKDFQTNVYSNHVMVIVFTFHVKGNIGYYLIFGVMKVTILPPPNLVSSCFTIEM